MDNITNLNNTDPPKKGADPTPPEALTDAQKRYIVLYIQEGCSDMNAYKKLRPKCNRNTCKREGFRMRSFPIVQETIDRLLLKARAKAENAALVTADYIYDALYEAIEKSLGRMDVVHYDKRSKESLTYRLFDADSVQKLLTLAADMKNMKGEQSPGELHKKLIITFGSKVKRKEAGKKGSKDANEK